MLRLVDYGRVSTDEQFIYGTGLETQRIEDSAYAKMIGAVIVGYESDPGVSGTIYPREGLERALARIQRGEADGLLVHRVDRLGRKMYIPMMVYERLLSMQARLFTCQDGEVDESNILLFCIRCGMAQTDYQQIVANMKGGKRRQAERGLMPCRARSPYGYHIVKKIEAGVVQSDPGTYRIVEEQAVVIKQIFALYAAGLSLDAICQILTVQGTPPPTKPFKRAEAVWLRSTVNRIIDNPVYKGMAMWGRTKRTSRDRSKMPADDPARIHSSKGTYRENTRLPESEHVKIPVPPIIDADLWERCQQRRRENKAHTERNDRKHLYTGLLFCPVCGLRLTITGAKGIGRYLYYKCSGKSALAKDRDCAKKLYPEPTFTAALVEYFRHIVDDPGFAATAYSAHVGAGDQAETAAELAAVRKKLADLRGQEEATVRAQITAIRTGARSEIYEELLTEIARERSRLEQRSAALAVETVQRRRFADIDVVTVASATAEVMLVVLQSEFLTNLEKNQALRRTVQSITPTEGGYKIILRPFLEGESTVLVALITISATSTQISGRFEPGQN